MTEPDLEDRARAAFRSAVSGHQPPVEVDPAAVRRRHRVRTTGVTLVVAAATLAVLGGAVAVGLGLPGGVDAAGPHVTAAPTPQPSGSLLRTEYYRDIGFDVPESWTYGYETPLCGQQLRDVVGYVQLGELPRLPRPTCDPMPAVPAVDHVVVTPAEGSVQEATTFQDGWWTSVRRVGGVEIRAVARQRADAEAMVGSAAVRQSTCPAHSMLERDPEARPATFDVTNLDSVTAITLCQYDVTGDGATSGLRAVARIEGGAAQRALAAFRSAPADRHRCQASGNGALDEAVVVQLETGNGVRELVVRIGDCAGEDTFGLDTVDDGTVQRRLTRDSCAALQVEPVDLYLLTGDATEVC